MKGSPPDKEKQFTIAAHARSVAAQMSKEGWDSNRLLAGMDFFLLGAVRLDEGIVESGNTEYTVDREGFCSCEDSFYRKIRCKHIAAMELGWRVTKRMEKAAMENEHQAWADNTDDIPEPPMPPGVDAQSSHVAEEHPGTVTHTTGYQYSDYPSTLCIKRLVGQTELMWTFRGQNDAEVWGRATRMIHVIDEKAKGSAPPAPAAPAPSGGPVPPVPAAPPPPPPAQKAVNRGYQEGAPYCHEHAVYFDLWSKGDRTWYSHKAGEGFCNHRG